MKRTVYAAVLLSLFMNCGAQQVNFPFSQVYTGIGTYGKSAVDAFSFTRNQAALAGVKQTTAGIYSERVFMLKELSVHYGALAVPFKKGALGWQARYSGNPHVQYLQTGIGYGRSLSPALDLGIEVSYSSIRIPGYISSSSFNAGAGIILHMTDDLFAGVAVSEIGTGIFKAANKLLPAAKFTMGIGYEPSERLLVQCDVLKQGGEPPTLISGVQYSIQQQAFLRAAIVTASGAFIAGAGMIWKNIRTDISASYHARLGLTPGILITFTSFNRQIP
ncbi:MAG: hypothetical protein H7Y03_03105 [Chitinophagaceae bacterium]|nr:hypothetical protein [Chitinophagaceae bacterium]